MEGTETYNHSKDVCPRKDPNNASTRCTGEKMLPCLFCFFLKVLILLGANGPPSYMPMASPTRKEESLPPPVNGRPFQERGILARAIWPRGGGGGICANAFTASGSPRVSDGLEAPSPRRGELRHHLVGLR